MAQEHDLRPRRSVASSKLCTTSNYGPSSPNAVCGAAVAVLVTWYTSGLGYFMSVVMAPQNSMVAAVAVCMIVGGFLNGVEPKYRTLTTPMKHVFGQ